LLIQLLGKLFGRRSALEVAHEPLKELVGVHAPRVGFLRVDVEM